MTSRDENILNAAQSLFMRYGIGRTTMADIAQSAGVARQTLYNAYANKDEVLRAVIRAAGQQDIAQIRAAWGTAKDLGEKIDIYYGRGPLAWFDLVANAPDAAEMIDGLHKVAQIEVAEATGELIALFSDLFAEAGASDPAALADFFVSSSKNAKYDVPDRATLVTRLAFLKSATLALSKQ